MNPGRGLGPRKSIRAGSFGQDRDRNWRSRCSECPTHQDQVEIARLAWRRFGKGRHAAGLNYGDCFAHALAKACRLPLLFQGDDFAQTDIAGAPPQTPPEIGSI
jgi:uncharacterized protein with PIN domain